MSSKNYVGAGSFEQLLENDSQIGNLKGSQYAQLASDEVSCKSRASRPSPLIFFFCNWTLTSVPQTINRTVEALKKKNHDVIVVNNREEALKKLVQEIPEGASIYTTSSHSLVLNSSSSFPYYPSSSPSPVMFCDSISISALKFAIDDSVFTPN